jgi:hypothetical protein
LATFQLGGPDERELANVKSSLMGSHLIGVDGSAKLAEHLVGLWLDDLGWNHDEERKVGIDAVDLDAARHAVRAFFRPAALHQLILRPAGN